MIATTDGRSTRWESHRQARRHELVDAAVRAIRRHGAGVGMDDLAAVAGTSKTVIYRHFTDRAGLYHAVSERVETQILHDISKALASSDVGQPEPRAVIAATIDAYLTLVERDPQLYRFCITPPPESRRALGDPAADLVTAIVERISAEFAGPLAERHEHAGVAGMWAFGLVGMVRAAADAWLAQDPRMPRTELTRILADLAWSGASCAYEEER